MGCDARSLATATTTTAPPLLPRPRWRAPLGPVAPARVHRHRRRQRVRARVQLRLSERGGGKEAGQGLSSSSSSVVGGRGGQGAV
eukprot:6094560-Pyramimonas_sp.AAC.1